MTDSWKKMETGKEEEFFTKQNQEALARLKARDAGKIRRSPITGEPMQQVTMFGVVVDKCPTSGYIGLDAGELEEILKAAKNTTQHGWFLGLFEGLVEKR